jgi:hypothetical protein
VFPLLGIYDECRAERIERIVGVTGGWIQGKPLTALMRELMNDAQDGDLLLILKRWGWLRVQHEQDRSLRIGLTERGREVLSDGD